MRCDKCGIETDTIVCPTCNNAILRIGQYCYLCGARLEYRIDEQDEEQDQDGLDLENRILCSDGACIGVVENGVCKVCGKPYIPEQ